MLSAIVYVSTATTAMSSGALEALLLDARAHNQANDVTGVLLYRDGTFMQYFEGPEPAMHETYRRILGSRRHTRVAELLNDDIDERQFPGWEMALAEPTASEMLALSTARWVLHDSGAAAGGRRSLGFALLRDFWRRQRR